MSTHDNSCVEFELIPAVGGDLADDGKVEIQFITTDIEPEDGNKAVFELIPICNTPCSEQRYYLIDRREFITKV